MKQLIALFFYLETINLIVLSQLQLDETEKRLTQGGKKGVIRNFELKLARPLQQVIRLMHFNELPIRHLFESVDNDTTGPTSLSGKFGKNLTD